MSRHSGDHQSVLCDLRECCRELKRLLVFETQLWAGEACFMPRTVRGPVAFTMSIGT